MRAEMPEDVRVTDPAMLIRINKLYRPGMAPHELYEATRGVWRAAERRMGARYALAVHGGVVLEVYEIASWHPAGSTPYTTRSPSDVNRPGRVEFIGRRASEDVRQRYVGRSVAAYWERGAANPILYVNC